MEKLPHLNSLLCDKIEDVTEWAEMLVISTKEEAFKQLKPKAGQPVFDLVRIKELENNNNYNGLCW